ncbi:phosphotransferase [Ferrimonas balearica]|uniref:phosphotransferase n=1 Tax=Ferrimonas balearica TaxID=44012 RepID=UPI001C992E3A|nr:phosphotransferase [Ferrimonas balearica]MBY5920713.1 phosphotransferase [Ferrimonas balearica]MBY5996602.1 phosphotransferase [Ferrimonas balearica]
MSDRLDEALTRLERAGFQWERVSPIGGGLGNRLWRLSGSGDWVLRLHNPNLAFCVDREQESRIWQAASAIDRAPELRFWDPQFSLADYGGVVPDTVPQASLLALMLELHQIGGGWQPIDPAQRILDYLRPDSDKLQRYLPHLPEWMESLQQSRLPSGLIHGDLHPGNLLIGPDGRWRAIDFEYAGTGSPLMDLAPWLVDAPDEPGLWQAYLDARGVEANDTEWQAMRAAVVLYLLMSAAWADQMAHSQKDPIYSQWRTHYFEQIGVWMP